MVEALGGQPGDDLGFLAHDDNRALGRPAHRLDLGRFLLATEGLDGLVEDGVDLLGIGRPTEPIRTTTRPIASTAPPSAVMKSPRLVKANTDACVGSTRP
jgi:hypothetical protein